MSRAFMIKQAPFKPTDIGGCQLWLDLADITSLFQNTAGTIPVTADSQNIQYIKDKSIAGNNASTTATGMIYRARANGGFPSVYFPGTQSLGYTMNLAFGISDATYFFVVNNQTTDGSTTVYFAHVGSSYTKQFWWYSSSLALDIGGIGGILGPTNVNQLTTIVSCTEVASTSILNGWQNGNPFSVTDKNMSGAFNTSYNSGVLGTDNGLYPMTGYVSEVIIFNRILDSSDRPKVEAYLAQKWGLRQQLPQGHPGTRGIVYPSQPIPTAIYWRYPSAFTPLQIQTGSCQMWLDAADSNSMTLSGSSVVTVLDKSGNGNTLSGGSGWTYNVTKFNSTYPSFYRATTGSVLGQNNTFSITSSNITVFFVGEVINTGGQYYLVDGGSAGINRFYTIIDTPTNIVHGNSVNANNNYSLPATVFQPFIFSQSTGTSPQTGSYNGTAINASAGTVGTITWSGITVGGRFTNASDWWSGHICEVIIYSTLLSTNQRQQVEGYLAWKWGIQSSLPSNHPYKNSSPNITNPAGISRPANVLPIPSIACTPIRTYSLVTAGLVFHIDAGNSASYPGSGSTWYDLTASGLNITLYGGPTYSAANGGSLFFVPTSFQYGQTSAPLDLPLWTLEAWTYYNGTNTGNWPNVITDMYTGNLQYCLGNTSASALSTGYLSGSWYVTSTYTITSGNWYHMVGTYDGTNVKLYVNGILQRTAAGTSTPVNGGAGFRIMRQWDGNGVAYWGGNLSIARMYNRGLSADEVNTNYQVSKARFGLS